MCDFLPWRRTLNLAFGGATSDELSPILQLTPSPHKQQQQQHSRHSSCCPSPLALPSPMCQKSPLRSHSLADMFVRLCNCHSSSSSSSSSSNICSCSSSISTASPAKITRTTPRSALVELKTDSNSLATGSSSSGSSSSSSPLKFTPPKLGRKQQASFSASLHRTKSPSPSTSSSKVVSPSFSGKSRALFRSRSGKRSFSESGAWPEDTDAQKIEEFKENDVAAAAQLPMVVSPFKRKRPPKLQIPIDCESQAPAAATQQQQSKDRKTEVPSEVSAEGRCFGVYSKKGHREVLEDTYQAILDIDGNKQQAFFGIFDGHGGRRAAEYAASHLSRNISEALNSGECGLEAAVRLGYLTTDAGFIQKQVSSGASCVTASVLDGSLVVANAGDCRAILSKAGKAVALTQDHRLEREDERRRVEDLGGYVDCYSGVWRLQGILAVSRGIGDIHLKEWVSAEPDVQRIHIAADCEFLILASDGLWDVVSNQEAVDCIRSELLKQSGLVNCSQKLAQLAAARGSMDDISVLTVDLKPFV